MTAVSVIIPCHNAEHWIGTAIGSALRQTCPPAEVIVVDDASIDESRKIAESFGGRVRVVPVEHRDAGAARATGANLAAGDALLFLDADDILGPDAVRGLAAALPQAGIARCTWRRYELFDEAVWAVRPASCEPLAPWQDALAGWLTGWYCPPCALLWSRDAYDASPGWRPGRYYNDDGELVMQALASGIQMAPAPFGEAFYRRSPGETVSGRRLSPEGVAAQAEILADLAAALENRGRLDAYRTPLRVAFNALARDSEAAGVDQIATEARSKAAALGIGGLDTLRHRARRLTAAGSHRAAPPVPRRQPAPSRAFRAAQSGALISVVVPTFERPAETRRAVESILRQDYGDLEVLVVDDASTDDTPAAVEGIGDARVRLIRQARNSGVAAARNRGISEAQASLVAFLDSDDEWLPGKITKSLEALSGDEDATGAVFTGARYVRCDGSTEERELRSSGWMFERLLRENPYLGVSALMRREVFDAVGGFDPAMPAIEDWEFWIRASRFFAFSAVPEALLAYHDEDSEDRRSRNFVRNMTARSQLFARYEADMRRAGVAQAFLMESARRELTNASGRAGKGRRLVARALALGPLNARLYPWIPYMAAPREARAMLRALDRRERPRPV